MKTEMNVVPALLFGTLENLNRFDAVEVSPVYDDGENCQVCEEGKESYWSVYLHYNADHPLNNLADSEARGVTCIADLPNKESAQALGNGIEAMLAAIIPAKDLIRMDSNAFSVA